LLFPCQHSTVVHIEALNDFKKSHPRVLIPNECTAIRGLPMDFTAIEIRLNISLSFDGDQSISVFSNSYSLHSQHLDRPIVEFSYVRKDEDCRLSCDKMSHSIYSTPSCIGNMISEDEIDVCDMTGNCKWKGSPQNLVKPEGLQLVNRKVYLVMNATEETVTYTSPYIAHTSIKCSFLVDAFMPEKRSSMDISYSTLDGNHSNFIHLLETHLPHRLAPFSLSIGHFFSPIRIEITCHKGSICKIDNLRMKNCEDDSPAVEVCPSLSSFLCSSSSHSKCLSHDRICDLVSDCNTGEDEENCDDIPSHGLCDFSNSSIWSFCPGWTSNGELNGISFGKATGRK
ncbi:hypothetical protein PENTCL1PPCAC_2424, partial [Pristionchus entomophagus]